MSPLSGKERARLFDRLPDGSRWTLNAEAPTEVKKKPSVTRAPRRS
jgi:hypothetical protein